MPLPPLDVLAALLAIDPADADDLDALAVLLCRRMLAVVPDDEPPDVGPWPRLVR